MKFSLILATLNRSKEIRECLKSLEGQKEKNFEVIVVDQSEDNLTKNVVDSFYSKLNIKYFKVAFKGLSKARNYGLNYADGEYIGLLDDDAIYRKDYLQIATKELEQKFNIVLSGRILSSSDYKTEFVNYKKIKNDKKLSFKDIMNYCPSAALIFPSKLVDDVGLFNENLGVGNEFASSEETEFLIRAYDKKYKFIYVNDMIAYHPIKPNDNLNSIYKHYEGKGALFKIDFFNNHRIRLLDLYFKNTIGMVLKSYLLDKSNKELYMTRFRGFNCGIKKYKL